MAYYHPCSPHSWPGFQWMLNHPDRPYCWTYLEKQDDMTWEVPVNELPLNHAARPQFDQLQGNRVRCSACGQSGHRGGRWMIAHLRGHAPCGKGCGTVLSVLQNLRPRSHARCPQ